MTFVTPNLSLTVWDLGDDPYDHRILANNFSAIDAHDHSPGRGAPLGSGAITDGSITNAKLAPNAVTTDKILNGTILQADLAGNSVGSAQIIDGSIGSAELADGSVGASKLDPNIVPLGTVLSWYRPNTGIPLPAGGWEICDGRSWGLVPNAWGQTTGLMPDLRGKFILGAGLSNIGSGPTQYPDIGQVGGSHTSNLAHVHSIGAHSHSIPDHSHSIGPDGAHAHGINPDTHDHALHSRPNAFATGIEVEDTSHNLKHNTLQSTYVAGFNATTADDPIPAYTHTHGGSTTSIGQHSHGGVTGTSGSGTTGSSSGNTDSQLGTVDTRPLYAGLLFIMRVR